MIFLGSPYPSEHALDIIYIQNFNNDTLMSQRHVNYETNVSSCKRAKRNLMEEEVSN